MAESGHERWIECDPRWKVRMRALPHVYRKVGEEYTIDLTDLA